MPEVWTKEQYLHWLKTRGEVGTWGIADCRKADEHIRYWALRGFDKYLTTHKDANIKPVLWQFLRTMVRCYFGSVEVDDLLIKLDCYPDWMENDEPDSK